MSRILLAVLMIAAFAERASGQDAVQPRPGATVRVSRPNAERISGSFQWILRDTLVFVRSGKVETVYLGDNGTKTELFTGRGTRILHSAKVGGIVGVVSGVILGVGFANTRVCRTTGDWVTRVKRHVCTEPENPALNFVVGTLVGTMLGGSIGGVLGLMVRDRWVRIEPAAF